MATGATIYKVNVSLSNLNSHHYEDYSLVLAKHPSEPELRMMFRLLAFLNCAHEQLEFTVGLNDPELPDIWQKDDTGAIQHWIELGQVDEKKVRKACGRSERVSVFTYQRNRGLEWYAKNKKQLSANKKVQVFHLVEQEIGIVENLVEKSMNLTCVIEDNLMHLSNDHTRASVEVVRAD